MCDRNIPSSDPTADHVLSDLITATEDLIDFAINVFDAIRLQFHFNDRNRRVNLAMQLKDANDAQKTEFGFVGTTNRPCTVTTTLKYDLALYLDRILQACKRTKANLMLLRVARTRPGNTTLLLVASTNVRVENLSKRVQLLTHLVKENGGKFPGKKKRKKKDVSTTKLDENKAEGKEETTTEKKQSTSKKKPSTFMSKEDLADYVEITLSFRTIITKYHEFIEHIRNVTRSVLSFNGQASVANAIVLIPIAANAVEELNNILNRLIRIAYTIEAESSSLRQPPIESVANDHRELYRQNAKELSLHERESQRQMFSSEGTGFSRATSPRPVEKSKSQKDGLLSDFRNAASLKRSNIRNQSAVASLSKLATISANGSAFKLTSNMIANIFEDFFINTDDLFD